MNKLHILAARAMIRSFGDQAAIEAARHGDRCAAAGDHAGHAAWSDVARLIGALLAAENAPSDAPDTVRPMRR